MAHEPHPDWQDKTPNGKSIYDVLDEAVRHGLIVREQEFRERLDAAFPGWGWKR